MAVISSVIFMQGTMRDLCNFKHHLNTSFKFPTLPEQIGDNYITLEYTRLPVMHVGLFKLVFQTAKLSFCQTINPIKSKWDTCTRSVIWCLQKNTIELAMCILQSYMPEKVREMPRPKSDKVGLNSQAISIGMVQCVSTMRLTFLCGIVARYRTRYYPQKYWIFY